MNRPLFILCLTFGFIFTVEAASADTSLSELNRQWPKGGEGPKWGKDPFYLPSKKETPRQVREKKEDSPREGFSLSGIIYTKDKAVAIINDRILRRGDSIGGYMITEIAKDRVVLSGKGEKLVLGVEKFTIKGR